MILDTFGKEHYFECTEEYYINISEKLLKYKLEIGKDND